MAKQSKMHWCSSNLFCKLFLISVLLQHSLGFDVFEDDKRQGLIPLARLGRARLLTALDDKEKSGNMLAYPRLGRRVWELHQTLIPYPRAGRLVVDPESLDYDVFLNADYTSPGLDDSFTDTFLSNQPVVQKKARAKLIPRIGRKKRSVSDEHDDQEDKTTNVEGLSAPTSSRSLWEELDDIDQDYYFGSDKKNMRSKNSFVPRVGKKRSEDFGDYENKRAAAFTPRIGRASLIPRIGRNDARFRLNSRAAFIPRIGRRAALIPRIGRSEEKQQTKKGTE